MVTRWAEPVEGVGVVARWSRTPRRITAVAVILFAIAIAFLPAVGAQELEARRWSHLPLGTTIIGAGYAYTDGDILFDPVLEIEDATVDLHTAAVKLVHSFGLLGKSARIDLVGLYQSGEWRGLLRGEPAGVDREGWGDPRIRFAVNLLGAPPLRGKEFAEYRARTKSETIVGAAVDVALPLGQYFDDKLINLGSNRFRFRPQLGLVQRVEKWEFELTGSASVFTDNDEFWGSNLREQGSLFTVQGHVAYTFRPGLWISTGIGYGTGGESHINGVNKDDSQRNFAWAASFGYSFTRQFGVKFGYLGTRALEDTGIDSNTVAVGVSYVW